jgi:hypothetical protein
LPRLPRFWGIQNVHAIILIIIKHMFDVILRLAMFNSIEKIIQDPALGKHVSISANDERKSTYCFISYLVIDFNPFLPSIAPISTTS